MALIDTEIYGIVDFQEGAIQSPFFGVFVRNAGAILLDREQSQMSGFFADIKSSVKGGDSIFIFPEGTRNKSEKPLLEFKAGFRIIAIKNRSPYSPYIFKLGQMRFGELPQG